MEPKTIAVTVSQETFDELKDAKADRTWLEVLKDGAEVES